MGTFACLSEDGFFLVQSDDLKVWSRLHAGFVTQINLNFPGTVCSIRAVQIGISCLRTTFIYGLIQIGLHSPKTIVVVMKQHSHSACTGHLIHRATVDGSWWQREETVYSVSPRAWIEKYGYIPFAWVLWQSTEPALTSLKQHQWSLFGSVDVCSKLNLLHP